MRLYMDAKAIELAERKVETHENGLVSYKFDSVGRKNTYVPSLIQGLAINEATALNEELGGGCHIDGHLYDMEE